MRRKKIKKKLSTRLLAFALSLTMVAGSFASNRLMVRANEDGTTATAEEAAGQTGGAAEGSAENVTQPAGEATQNNVPTFTGSSDESQSDPSAQPADPNAQANPGVQQTDPNAQADPGTQADPNAQPAGDPNGDPGADPNAGIAPAADPVNLFEMKLTARDKNTLAAVPGAYFEIYETLPTKDSVTNKWVIDENVQKKTAYPGVYIFPQGVYKTYAIKLVTGAGYETSDAIAYVTFTNQNGADYRKLEADMGNTTVKLPDGVNDEIFFNSPVQTQTQPQNNDAFFTFNFRSVDKKTGAAVPTAVFVITGANGYSKEIPAGSFTFPADQRNSTYTIKANNNDPLYDVNTASVEITLSSDANGNVDMKGKTTDTAQATFIDKNITFSTYKKADKPTTPTVDSEIYTVYLSSVDAKTGNAIPGASYTIKGENGFTATTTASSYAFPTDQRLGKYSISVNNGADYAANTADVTITFSKNGDTVSYNSAVRDSSQAELSKNDQSLNVKFKTYSKNDQTSAAGKFYTINLKSVDRATGNEIPGAQFTITGGTTANYVNETRGAGDYVFPIDKDGVYEITVYNGNDYNANKTVITVQYAGDDVKYFTSNRADGLIDLNAKSATFVNDKVGTSALDKMYTFKFESLDADTNVEIPDAKITIKGTGFNETINAGDTFAFPADKRTGTYTVTVDNGADYKKNDPETTVTISFVTEQGKPAVKFEANNKDEAAFADGTADYSKVITFKAKKDDGSLSDVEKLYTINLETVERDGGNWIPGVTYTITGKNFKTVVPSGNYTFPKNQRDGTYTITVSEKTGFSKNTANVTVRFYKEGNKLKADYEIDKAEQAESKFVDGINNIKFIMAPPLFDVDFQTAGMAVKDTGAGHVLKGAQFTLTGNGENRSWTSDIPNYKVSDLKPGEYYLKQTFVPEGYMANSALTSGQGVKITVAPSGEVSSSLNNNTALVVVPATQTEPTLVRVINTRPYQVKFKYINADGNGVSNARFEIYNGTTYVDGWNTPADGSEILQNKNNNKNLQPDTDYTLRQTKTPNGYDQIPEFTFRFDKKGNITLSDSAYTLKDENGDIPIVTLLAVPVGSSVTTSSGPVTYQIKAKKELTGGTLREGQFTFILRDSTGRELQRKTNAADGSITFDAITYSFNSDKPIEYKYTIEEVNDGQPGITYDPQLKKEVTVTVTSKEISTLNNSTLSGKGDENSAIQYVVARDGNGQTRTYSGFCMWYGRNVPNGTYRYYLDPTEEEIWTITDRVNNSRSKFQGERIDLLRKLLYGWQNNVEITVGEAKLNLGKAVETQKLVWYVLGSNELIGSENKVGIMNPPTITPAAAMNAVRSQVKNIPANYHLLVFAPDSAYQPVITAFSEDVDMKQIVGTTANTPVFKNSGEGGTTPVDFRIKFKKVDENGAHLADVRFELHEDGTKIDAWTTNNANQEVVVPNTNLPGLKAGVVYTLKEVDAPAGYNKLQDISFELDDQGKIRPETVKFADGTSAMGSFLISNADDTPFATVINDKDKSDIEISKVNIGGEEIAGARIQILRAADRSLVKEWVSTTTPTKVKLDAGDYIFRETLAPAAYQVVTEISFLVNGTGTVSVTDANGNTVSATGSKLTVTDEYKTYDILVKKVDENGKVLKGAEFTIVGSTRTATVTFTETTGADGIARFDKLSSGFVYTLKETVVPAGYVAPDILKESGRGFDFLVQKNKTTGEVSIQTLSTDDAVQVDNQTLTFTVKNTKDYEVPPSGSASVSIKAKKVFDGGTLRAGQFSFELLDANEQVLQTKTNDAEGNVYFDAITYTAAGTYTYYVREVEGTDPSIQYDKIKHEVTVTVTAQSLVGIDTAEGAYKGDTKPYSEQKYVVHKADQNQLNLNVYCVNYSAGAPGGDYTAILNPTTADYMAAGVTGNAEDIRKVLYYIEAFDDIKGERDKQGVVWEVTGHKTSYAAELQRALENSNPPANFTVVLFKSINGKQPIAGGFGTAMISVETPTFTNKQEDTPTGNLELTKRFVGGENLTDDQKNAIIFAVKGPNGYEVTVSYAQMMNGTYTLTGLDVGQYTVTESNANVPGYNLTTTYSVANGSTTVANGTTAQITVTNTYAPTTVEVKGTKTWVDDNNNADGNRPEKIVVILKANGTEVERKEVTAADGWAYSFTNLPEYKNGAKVVYTIEEEVVAYYTTQVNGYDITNTYAPETVEVTGTKTWDDAGNQDGKRPTQIVVILKADGTEVDRQTVRAVANGEWTYTFTNLPKYKNRAEINYTVEEEVPAGYTSSINGYDITNRYSPEEITVTVEKIWDDNNNQDNKRVPAVEIGLYKAGETDPVQTVTLDEGNHWQASFNAVAKRQGGNEIEYTVKEVTQIPDYDVTYTIAGAPAQTIKGADATVTVTNKHTPEATDVTVRKEWVDRNNADNNRPGSIELVLYKPDANAATGKVEVARATVRPAGNGDWTHTFTKLPKYENGAEIQYTVEETAIDGYAVIYGADADGTLVVTNTETTRKVVFSKKEIGGAGELAGAGVQVEKENGDVADAWVSGTTAHELQLEPGNYVFRETVAPAGFEIATAIEFTVGDDGRVTLTNITTATVGGRNENLVTMFDDYSTRPVSVSKKNVLGDELAGAELEIQDENGDVVTDENGQPLQWTSTGTAKEVQLYPGTYKLVETAAPLGYDMATEIEFTVEPDGTVTAANPIVTINGQDYNTIQGTNLLVMTDALTKRTVEISKKNIAGEEISGAQMVVTKTETGEEVDSWTSNGTAHTVQLEAGNYTLEETVAPGGYEIATKIEFTVALDGTVTTKNTTVTVNGQAYDTLENGVIVMTDGYKNKTVNVSKTDINGTRELGGATLIITDKNTGNEVDRWVSTEGVTHQVELQPGDYTLTEVTAPNGYAKAESIDFSVTTPDDDGNMYVTVGGVGQTGDTVVMRDAFDNHEVSVSKTDMTGTQELTGAELRITGRPDDMTQPNVNETWISDGTVHKVKLQPGRYTLTEDRAPLGYKVAESISFIVSQPDAAGNMSVKVVDKDGNETPADKVVMKDDYDNGEVIVSKQDFAGAEISGAEMKITRDTKDGPLVEGWTSDGTQHSVKLTPGTYVLTETTAPKGYKVAESITFVVGQPDAQGRMSVSVTDKNGNAQTVGSVVMKDEYDENEVEISKVDFGAGNELAGAELRLTGTPDDGSAYAGETWTSTGTVKKVKLLPGTYTLTEDQAPLGYEFAESITFKVAVDGSVTLISGGADTSDVTGNKVTMKDKRTLIEIPVTKIWDDVNNQDGKRPASVEVELYKQVGTGTPEATGLKVTLSEGNNWTDTFKDLEAYSYANNTATEIVYSIVETAVAAYDAPVYTGDHTGLTVTNKRTPEEIEITGKKVWDDDDNRDNKRPDSIIIRLVANGTETGDTVTIDGTDKDADGNWTFKFTNLPKYKDGIAITYGVIEEATGHTTTIIGSMADGFTVTNRYTPDKTNVTVNKAWDDNDNQDGIRPGKISVELYKQQRDAAGNLLGTPVLVTTKEIAPDQDGNWQTSFDNLFVKENGNELVYTVKEVQTGVLNGDDKTGYVSSVNGTTITNRHTPATVDVSGIKVWDDKDNQDGKRPAEIRVVLYDDLNNIVDQKTVQADANGDWKYEFTNLPKFRRVNGVTEEVKYRVDEILEQDSPYTKTVTGDMENGFEIKNAYTPEETQIAVLKVWDDALDQDGIRPDSVTVRLMADYQDGNGVVYAGKEIEVKKADGYAGSFDGLDRYADGKLIDYSVEEVQTGIINGDEQTGYVMVSTEKTLNIDNSYTITNRHTPETVSVTGTKIWDDNANQDGIMPDSVTIVLLANNVEVDRKIVTAAEDWKYSFIDLPRYENGVEISYTVAEADVAPGYQPIYPTGNGAFDAATNTYTMDITNVHTPNLVAVFVAKVWNDAGNADGIRPGSVTIRLYADGVDTGRTLTLNAANVWSGSFTDLPEFREGAQGVRIIYTISEDTVAGYATTITENEAGRRFTVTNTHTPPETPPPTPPTPPTPPENPDEPTPPTPPTEAPEVQGARRTDNESRVLGQRRGQTGEEGSVRSVMAMALAGLSALALAIAGKRKKEEK